MSNTENIILIDWLCFTTKDTDVEKMIHFLGLERLNFVECNGHYGYKTAKTFGGIWIMYDGGKNENAGLCVEMSGQGCRQYETSGLYNLGFLCDFLAHHSDKYHITRLDVAFDDVDHEGGGLLNMQDIEYYARADLYVLILSISLDTIYAKNFSKFLLIPPKYPRSVSGVDIWAGGLRCGV